ncbi:AAA family ATPase [Marinobacter arenosus]|uniref:AAA family ATPase n=1 Tax=Marinobacter arenosus TaxID=2856822 RepID=UPI001C4C74E9|nr:AAA family ATPase [Marinobacter arenosus]MBW0148804.1 AAA family ATPase [Marinobacter arenosus]
MITNITMDRVASYKQATVIDTNKQVTLIYGLNGTGKSTISNFLYSPHSPVYRHCKLSIAPETKKLVYNQNFINDNFYEAEKISGVFSLSKENKEAETKIENLTKDLNEKTDQLRQLESNLQTERQSLDNEKSKASDKTWEIKQENSTKNRTLDSFLEGKKGNKETLFNYLSEKVMPSEKPTKSIEKIRHDFQTLSDSSAKKYQTLPPFSFNHYQIEKDEIFKEAIVGNNDSTVSKLIDHLNNSDWVRKGLDFLNLESEDDQSCPFCQQKTITKPLLENIKDYFDESFDGALDSMRQKLTSYEKSLNSLKSFEEIEKNPFIDKHIEEIYLKYNHAVDIFTANIEKIKEKINSPSQRVELNSTAEAIEDLNHSISDINSEISEHNKKIDNKKDEVRKLKDEFWDLMRWTYDQTISFYKSKESEISTKIKGINQSILLKKSEIQTTNSDLSKAQSQTVNIDDAINNINQNLEQLGITDFKIVKHSDTLYKIVRDNQSDADFTSLSEGEKTVITFLYFCELCKGKASPNDTTTKKSIIIDDPVSSLSHIYVFNVAQMLKRDFFYSQLYEQVIVLTHSLYFFYDLTETKKDNRDKKQNLLRLSKNATGTSIKKMKYEEIQNDYHAYWSVINDPNQPPALIANCMRNIIEYFFNFVEKSDLSVITQKPELQSTRFQAFCRYINRESHSLGQNIFDFKEFNYTDFKEGLRLVFYTQGYKDHYDIMTAKISA